MAVGGKCNRRLKLIVGIGAGRLLVRYRYIQVSNGPEQATFGE